MSPRPAAVTVLAALLLCAPAGARGASLEQARDLAAAGDTARALAEVDALLEQRPQDVEARLMRGVLLARSARSEAAIEQFTAIAREHPELPEPHNNLAVLYAAEGRYDDARRALLEAVRLQPEYHVAHENLGDVYTKLGQLAYARAHRIEPSNRRAADKAAAAEALLEIGAGRAAAGPLRGARAEPGGAAHRCFRASGITPASRARTIAARMRRAGMEVEVGGGAARYRVLIPPLSGAAEARDRIEALRAKGVRDVIVLTRGEHRHGISLGVFGSREHAEARVRDLRERGIPTRIETLGGAAARIAGRTAMPASELAAAFPGLDLQIEECP